MNTLARRSAAWTRLSSPSWGSLTRAVRVLFMTYKKAMKECRKVGTNNATGDALRAMYAALIAQMHGGSPERYFQHLQKRTGGDVEISIDARGLLRDRAKAYDVLIA